MKRNKRSQWARPDHRRSYLHLFNRDTSLTIAVGCDEGLLLCVSSGLSDGKALGSKEEIALGRDDGKSLVATEGL
jgi:hypothetical protein